MNPLRALFLNLSRMPPAIMLMLIIGMAVVVTMVTTGRITQKERQAQSHQRESELMSKSTSGVSNKKAVYSRCYIPAGAKIENKQIELRDTNDLEVWDDAEVDSASVAGNISKHAIPANAQIRKIDIE